MWAILGGALIAYVPATAFKLFLVANSSLIIGVLVGALVGFFGLMLWFARPLRVVLGVLILLLSLASFLTSDFGGLLVGMLMGLVGGSLALAWVPTKVTWRERRRAHKLAQSAEPALAAATVVPPEAAPEDVTDTADAGEIANAGLTEATPTLTTDLLGTDGTDRPAAPATVDDEPEQDRAAHVTEPAATGTRHRTWWRRARRHNAHLHDVQGD